MEVSSSLSTTSASDGPNGARPFCMQKYQQFMNIREPQYAKSSILQTVPYKLQGTTNSSFKLDFAATSLPQSRDLSYPFMYGEVETGASLDLLQLNEGSTVTEGVVVDDVVIASKISSIFRLSILHIVCTVCTFIFFFVLDFVEFFSLCYIVLLLLLIPSLLHAKYRLSLTSFRISLILLALVIIVSLGLTLLLGFHLFVNDLMTFTSGKAFKLLKFSNWTTGAQPHTVVLVNEEVLPKGPSTTVYDNDSGTFIVGVFASIFLSLLPVVMTAVLHLPLLTSISKLVKLIDRTSTLTTCSTLTNDSSNTLNPIDYKNVSLKRSSAIEIATLHRH